MSDRQPGPQPTEPDDQHDPDLAACLAGELALLNNLVTANREHSLDLIHPAYEEFGHTGRAYTIEHVHQYVAASPTATDIDTEGLRAARLDPWSILVTYVSEHAGRRANRSSLWLRCADGRWRLRHHQSTIAADA